MLGGPVEEGLGKTGRVLLRPRSLDLGYYSMKVVAWCGVLPGSKIVMVCQMNLGKDVVTVGTTATGTLPASVGERGPVSVKYRERPCELLWL